MLVTRRPGRRLSTARVLLATLATLGVAATACATTIDGNGTPGPLASRSPGAPASATASAAPRKPVQVSTVQGDNQTYGVGEPIIARFNPAPTDASAFVKATTVMVDGEPATGGWYWERPYADGPIEAHYRTQDFWPAHSR